MKKLLIAASVIVLTSCSKKISPTRVVVSGTIDYYQNDTLKQKQPFKFDIPIEAK